MQSFETISILICGLSVFLGTVIQTGLGIGLGLIAVPIIALIRPSLLPATLLLLAFPLTVWMAFIERSSIDIHGFTWMFVGRIVGSIIGSWLVVIADERALQALSGSLVFGAVVLSIPRSFLPIKRTSMVTVGIASGIMGTVAVIGGAPLALLYQDRPGPELRSTLSMMFALGTLFSIIVLWIPGQVNKDQITAAIILLPALVLGYIIGRKFKVILNGSRIRIGVLFFSGVSGAAVLISSIFG